MLLPSKTMKHASIPAASQRGERGAQLGLTVMNHGHMVHWSRAAPLLLAPSPLYVPFSILEQ